MSNGLEVFNKILFLNLRPWMQGQVSEQKYLELLQEVQKEHYQFQPLFKVTFPKPVNNKRKYYAFLMENAAISYFNSIHSLISRANDNGKKYWVNDTINKKLKPKLKEAQQVIKENGYTREAINTTSNTTNYEDLRDNSYIIQLLKFHLIHIYLEFQNIYAHLLSEDQLTEEEIRQYYFSEAVIDKPVLTKADEVKLPATSVQIKVEPEEKSLPVYKLDFRPEEKGVLPFDVMIKNPDRFASFEEELYSHDLIDNNRNFKNIHGQLQELAAVYYVLIRKGYFNKMNLQKRKEITPLDVRKFLDHRYAASTIKQFNIWKNDPDGLAAFIEKYYWLAALPTC
ncbi:DUF6617 family protein [Aridibaculum aurantiacum]|uniref:DUF6617 family protein n=1 Tax=Aridibaculum aurantiacum TaxID=2810307 RepID=UPI001A96E13C|nr:DUF6617 family protein [Aridibaculum aurantiacum]